MKTKDMDYAYIVKVWTKSQILQTKRTWNGIPEATAFVEQLAADWPSSKDHILPLIQHSNALVVAHALLCARRANEPKLAELDDNILKSKAGVTIIENGFSVPTDIGSLARKWAKEIKLLLASDSTR